MLADPPNLVQSLITAPQRSSVAGAKLTLNRSSENEAAGLCQTKQNLLEPFFSPFWWACSLGRRSAACSWVYHHMGESQLQKDGMEDRKQILGMGRKIPWGVT